MQEDPYSSSPSIYGEQWVTLSFCLVLTWSCDLVREEHLIPRKLHRVVHAVRQQLYG